MSDRSRRSSLEVWRWYVYEIVRGERVIYVGKGSGDRCLVSAKEKCGDAVKIASFKHEEHAYVFERARIKERLAEGFNLLNVSNGTKLPWQKRTDTRAYAREALEEVAWRFGRWIKAGRLSELASRIRMPESQILSVYQTFGK